MRRFGGLWKRRRGSWCARCGWCGLWIGVGGRGIGGGCRSLTLLRSRRCFNWRVDMFLDSSVMSPSRDGLRQKGKSKLKVQVNNQECGESNTRRDKPIAMNLCHHWLLLPFLLSLYFEASITIFWKVNHVDTTIRDFSSLCAHRQHCRRHGYWSLVWRWLEDEARYKTGMLPLYTSLTIFKYKH